MGQEKNHKTEYLKAKIKAYEKYLPQRIVEKINTNPYNTRVEGERRFVTILFGDVSGFTALSERLDPEDVIKVINKYFNKMLYIVEKYGGDVDKFVGDAIMVVFGAPVAHKDDPERAVRAALEMQKAIETIEPVLAKGEYIKVRMSIGINTGEIVALNMGTDERMEYTVMGDNVNLSARLEAVANATEVIISDRTYKYVKDIFEFETMEPVFVKGKKEPIPIYKALSIKEKSNSEKQISLIGYDDEIKHIEKMFDSATDIPFSIGITGDEGTGKSKLLEFITEIADRKNIISCNIRGESFSLNIPFAPIKQLFRSYLKLSDGESAITVKEKIDNVFAKENRKGLYYIFNIENTDSLKKEILINAIMKSLISMIEIMKSTSRILMIFEDMHFYDDLTLQIMARLIKFISSDKMISYVFSSRQAIESHTDLSIVMHKLNTSDIEKLMRHMFNDSNIHKDFIKQIEERTNGHPAYCIELCNYIKSNGLTVVSDGSVKIDETTLKALPDSLKSVFLEKIDSLPEAEKQFLQYVSVGGFRFNKKEIFDIYKLNTAELDEILKSLTDKGYIFFEGHDVFFFSTEIFRDAVYNSLMKNKRKQLHNAFGLYYESCNIGSEYMIRNAASHYYEAGNLSKAPVFLNKSGDMNKSMFAYRDALKDYKRAIEFLEKGSDFESLVNTVFKSVSMYISLGSLKEAMESLETNKERSFSNDILKAGYFNFRGMINDKMGRYDEAGNDYLIGLDIAESVDDVDLIGKINNNLGILNTVSGKYKEALNYFNSALSMSVKSDKWKDIASQYINIGRINAFIGDHEHALSYLQKAVDIINKYEDESRLIIAMMNIAYVYDITGKAEKAYKTYNDIVHLADRINDTEMRLKALNNLATIDFTEGKFSQAMRTFREIEQVHEQTGNIKDLAEVRVNIAELDMASGNLQNAMRGFESAITLCEQCNHQHLITYANVYYANVLMLTGYLGKAQLILKSNIKKSIELNLSDFMIMSKNILATVMGICGYLNEEKVLLDEAMSESLKLNNPELINSVKLTVSKMETELGHYIEAEKLGLEVQTFAEANTNEMMMSDVLATLSDIYQRTGNGDKLASIADKSYKISEKTDNRLSAVRNYLSMARFYLINNDCTSCEEELKIAEQLIIELKSAEHAIMLYSIYLELYLKTGNTNLYNDALIKQINIIDSYINNAGNECAVMLLKDRRFTKHYAHFIKHFSDTENDEIIKSHIGRFSSLSMRYTKEYMKKEHILNEKIEKIL